MCNEALHVIGFCGLGDKISLLLRDWELAKVAMELPHGPGHGSGYREACCRGRAVTAKERVVVRGKNWWKGGVAGLGELSGLVGIFLFIFCCSVYICAFLE